MITLEQKYLIIRMKNMGIDRETTSMTASLLKTKEQVSMMWRWMNSLKSVPNSSEIYDKVYQIIMETRVVQSDDN